MGSMSPLSLQAVATAVASERTSTDMKLADDGAVTRTRATSVLGSANDVEAKPQTRAEVLAYCAGTRATMGVPESLTDPKFRTGRPPGGAHQEIGAEWSGRG